MSLFAESGLEENLVHVLPVKHVVDVTPLFLVIGKRVGIDGLPRFPLCTEGRSIIVSAYPADPTQHI